MLTGKEQCTILVVDDEAEVRNIAMAVLEDLGYETIAATSGACALRILATTHGRHVDVLFSDIMMPGMNGFELAQQAKALRPDLKIILTSGYIGLEIAIAMSSGMYPTVPKPWRPAQFAKMMAEVLGISRS
jgi:CheY-like chemotaxis protein